MRRAAVAIVAAAATTVLATACGPGDAETGAATAATAAPTSAAGASAGSSAPAPGSTSSPAAKGSPAAPSTGPSKGASTGASAGAAPACAAGDLKADAHQAKERPDGTGIGAAIIGFANTSGHACTLKGFPTVAGAGNGGPGHNMPLTVTHTGSEAAVKLAPGGKAWVKLTFVQVQGEADGYCVSGATPVAFPSLVLGLPEAGSHQVGLDEGLFAECDNKVTTTAVLAVSPS
ncbi:DUF4232 domain-containing protein [Streptomyces kaniharaensis]|uniref:DUF4232 domain-containing protein n=1 Tax=Streptomyces kaniharaensis TaxID=212423 RepID=A0A6N7KYX1_9ACTN|nr:DUF4232 domain-containing protein [Streptomyces kaniharaensis]